MKIPQIRSIQRNLMLFSAAAGVGLGLGYCTSKEIEANREMQLEKAVQEALKMDSVAKANYALGMQAVRDSIEAAKK